VVQVEVTHVAAGAKPSRDAIGQILRLRTP